MVPIIIYVCNFYESGFSKDNEDWSKFGSYLSGVLSPVFALLGIYFTWTVSNISNKREDALIKREEMKQRPLAYVFCGNYDNNLSIRIQNKGLGVLIMKSYNLIHQTDATKNVKSINKLVNRFDSELNQSTGYMGTEIIEAGKEKVILLAKNPFKKDSKTEFEKDPEEFIMLLNQIRAIIKNYRIEIVYTDIFGNQEYSYSRDFSWFSNNLP